jgi:hypothetical protein
MTRLDPAHVAWCRQHFAMMADGGTWAIPRSGMIFNKRGNTLVLAVVMPHMNGMPCTPEELIAQQRDEFENCREHFAAAGVTVINEALP